MSKKDLSKSKVLVRLKADIEAWRRNKTSPRMPEELWKKAAAKARLHGVAPVSRLLKIGYAELGKRVELKKTQRGPTKGFVELPVVSLDYTGGKIEVRLENGLGESATVRSCDPGMNWEQVFAGWLNASRSCVNGRPQ